MRKALGIVAMAGLFLLLLSALVVASPQESALARHIEPPTIPPDVMLTALVSPDGMLAAQANGGSQGARMDVRLDVPPMDGLKRPALCAERISGVQGGGGGWMNPGPSCFPV